MNRLHGTLILATLCVVAGAPAAFGHHFKGLPHFSYFENYPQVPQDEYLGQAGPYEFSLVLYDFQGIKKQDAQQPDDTRLFLAIYSLRENRTYQGPLTLKVMDGDRMIRATHFDKSVEESLYSLQMKLPPTGDYALVVDLEAADGLEARIPFRLSSQKIHWGGWVAAVLVILVVTVAVGSRKARVALDRKERARAERERAVPASA
ncbi:MAG: hypothetical protein OER86_00425 [Phycisphaerae bacterium]|nr:hypothetical protein [Phycisphaerae bacterium]